MTPDQSASAVILAGGQSRRMGQDKRRLRLGGPGDPTLLEHTGGMLPRGCDAVVMVENTQQLDERMLEVVRAAAVGENVIPVGEDVRLGDLLFARGHRLRPQDLGGLAGVGIVSAPVVARPRVAILATGDEVVPAHGTSAS